MQLKELQQQFKSRLFSQESEIARHIVSDNLSSEFRLSLYADGYVLRLAEVLENDYPALRELLGDESFYELSQQYIAKHPSTFTSLRWFGQHMPAFLQESEQYKHTIYLAELAQLEWTLVNAFNAADQSNITETDVARVPVEKWPELSFGFHASVHSFTYRWNILPMWQAYKEHQPYPKPAQLSAPEKCLVWRQELNTLFRTLEHDESQLFDAARSGANFSQLCEILSDHIQEQQDPQQIPLRAAGLLKTWISAAMLSELKF